ncbi:hypothetical protein [Actinomadura chokoriensis]|uniref:Uncharacterized protein n=1 Tax=Actinomadura chokoriensis TaxID=454156 RepID=A0ABV4QY34_9ACTN
MIAVLVLVSLLAMFGLCLPGLLRPMPPSPAPDPPAAEGEYPESMTAELDPGDEEFLAALADELWPEDEYLELEQTTDGEEEPGGTDMLL